jgi:hypothetical protein
MNAVHPDYRRFTRFLDGFATRGGLNVMATALGVLLVAVTAMAGIYAIAASTATSAAAAFTPTERASHARIVEFAAALKRASTEKKAARAQCDLLNASGKQICTAKARAEEKRAKAEARALYNAGSRPVIDAGKKVPESPQAPRGADVALNTARFMSSDIAPQVVTSRTH